MISPGGSSVLMWLTLPLYSSFAKKLTWAFLWMLLAFAVLMFWSKNIAIEHLSFGFHSWLASEQPSKLVCEKSRPLLTSSLAALCLWEPTSRCPSTCNFCYSITSLYSLNFLPCVAGIPELESALYYACPWPLPGVSYLQVTYNDFVLSECFEKYK